MPRYIDADKLFAELKNNLFVSYLDIINSQPTADVVEVRHGEWLDTDEEYVCSECHCISEYMTNYCPDCGAKMKKIGE